MTPLPGILGPYQILDEIGAGGMATVYKAYQPSMDRHVAVKVLAQQLSQDPDFQARFRQEARAIAKLEHAHILPAYDFGEHEGILYIVMRFIQGGTLKDRLSAGPLPFPEIQRIMVQVGNALDYAHRMGVIHRDIKPSNILMDWEGNCFLADFGLARLMTGSADWTKSGVKGTANYMSPEQAQGLQVDHHTDIYSLGVMLYEMVTGRLPYEAESPMGVVLKHLMDPVPLIHHLMPDVPTHVEHIILKAMAKSPFDRYPHVAEMVGALADHVLAQGNEHPATEVPPALPPFVAGPPVTHPRQFFGRERILKRLFNFLKQPPLQNAAIIGPKRSGKTSLLHYLKTIPTTPPEQLRPGQTQDWLSNPHRYRWVFVDFQDPRMGTREGLLRHLLAQLNLSEITEGSQPERVAVDMDRFMEIVSQNLHSPAVILLDEIGVAMQRYAELDDPFWEGLRSLATNQVRGNLAFVLTAHEPPDQLARQQGFGSPFFNIFGYAATLGPLEEAEARALITSSPLPFSPADTEWLLAHSGRWPILLQILCRERLNALEEGATNAEWHEEALRQIKPFVTDTMRGEGPGMGLVEPFSDREVEVLKCIAQGLSNQEIAERLVVAVSTVKSHINNIYGKLGVNSRTQALAKAKDLGLL